QIAAFAGCKTTTSAVLVHCLRQKTEDELMEITLKMSHPFLPTMVDGMLLPKTPEEMLAEKNFNNVPYMVGINKQEFGWIIPLVRKSRPCRRFAQPVAVFLGVPFAKPPLGSLRFAPPQPAEPWTLVKNTTSYPPMCSQDPVGAQLLSDLFTNRKENISLTFSEDCLYLNIYTPADLTKRSRLPVMVWIHGGGLMVGGASTYDGLALSAHENVVVVLSPLAKNLFHRAISESGVALTSALLKKDMKAAAERIAAFAGCKTITSAVLVHCLRQKTEDELLEITQKMNFFTLHLYGDPRENYPFLPTVVDGVLLPKMPEEMLAEKNFNTVPYIIGINKQEFGWILPLVRKCRPHRLASAAHHITPPICGHITPHISGHRTLPSADPSLGPGSCPLHTKVDISMETISDGGTDDPVKKKGLFLDLIADGMFGVPSVNVARRHRDAGAPTYMYEFRYRPSFSSELKPETIGVNTRAAEKLKDKEVAFWNELLSERP
ncbi:hypothetical protein Celaphus_00004130, partial [Cervus elaphus hippelaphus]